MMQYTKKYDLVVIGSGPGGYVAAIKAAQKGIKVALIEKDLIGGSCLNVGCIPTKALLSNAAVLQKIKKASEYGIEIGSVTFDYSKMKKRKDAVIEKIRKSLEGLILSHGIEILRGKAEFLDPRILKITGQDNVVVYAEKTIIATGSVPLDIPAFPCDHKRIFNSSSLLDLETLPESIAIIGGGYIGCEFASLFAELGVKVTILEALGSIVSLQGKSVSETLTRTFTKKGITIKTGVFVEGITAKDNHVVIKLKDQGEMTASIALVSVGRKVVSEKLGLDKAGVLVNERGSIPVNDYMETNVPGIYAIGDVTGKVLLAHVASHQGIVAAAHLTGENAKMHYNAVPAVIFTSPEIACVGMTQEEAENKGLPISIGKFPFQALGKSIASGDVEGYTQIISHKKTGQILGAEIVGYDASALIAEMTLAIANELTVDCVIDTIHAHPTTSEAWLEAALLANDTPIHMPPKTKKTV